MSDTKSRWAKAQFEIQNTDQATFLIAVAGRARWALECLMEAGAQGCTPIEKPGPRWSGYVHDLRELGVQIETVTEPHGGPFKRTHARYVLRSSVHQARSEAA